MQNDHIPQHETADAVKAEAPATIVPPAPRRVRLLNINYITIALPDEIEAAFLEALIRVLDRSKIIETNYSSGVCESYENDTPDVTLTSQFRTIYPSRAALEAAIKEVAK